MDRTVATRLLQQELAKVRQRGYRRLLAERGDEVVTQVVGPDGEEYTMSVQLFWDKEEHGPLRVIVSIDDGGLRAIVPLTIDDIVYPDTK